MSVSGKIQLWPILVSFANIHPIVVYPILLCWVSIIFEILII